MPGWPIGTTIVGFDFAGVIKQVGSKVSNLKEGDEVYGFAKVNFIMIHMRGNICIISNLIIREAYVRFQSQMLLKLPRNLPSFHLSRQQPFLSPTSHHCRASETMVFLTFNNRSLHSQTTGKLQEGGRILVIGASGGCGLACLQVKYTTIFLFLIYVNMYGYLKARYRHESWTHRGSVQR